MRLQIRKDKKIGFTFLLIILACKYGIYHKVENEKLEDIARKYNLTVEEIIKANIKNEFKDYVFIPLKEKKEKKDVKNENTIEKPIFPEKKKIPGPKELGPKYASLPKNKLTIPVEGEIISDFGLRDGRLHKGIDIKAPEGTPIRAVMDGEVIFSGFLRGYGNTIIIKSGNIFTVYAHNKVNMVKEGDRVRKGDIIGKVGMTGNATTPHLHFEVRKGVEPQDPKLIIR